MIRLAFTPAEEEMRKKILTDYQNDPKNFALIVPPEAASKTSSEVIQEIKRGTLQGLIIIQLNIDADDGIDLVEPLH